MNRKAFANAKPAMVVIGALVAALVIAISQAGPPPPRPRRQGPRVRRHVQRRHVLRRRRRLVVRRVGTRVVIRHGAKVIRKAPPPVIVKSVTGLKAIPTKVQTSVAYKVVAVGSDCKVVLEMDRKKTPVRLIGVENVLPAGASEADKKYAQRAFERLFAGEFVYMEHDSSLAREDEDGNTVAYLYRAPDKLFLNLELIRQGSALAGSDYSYDHKELFSFYEGKAQADKKGVWRVESTGEAETTAATPETETSP